MPIFSKQELKDTVLLYGEIIRNAAMARRLYVLYTTMFCPSRHTFQPYVEHLVDHGSFRPQT